MPPKEEPHVSSTLKWSEVSLPDSVVQKLDLAILRALTSRWLKVARVVGDVVLALERTGVHMQDEVIAARIGKLVSDKKIEAQGDVEKWRHSEVRLKLS